MEVERKVPCSKVNVYYQMFRTEAIGCNVLYDTKLATPYAIDTVVDYFSFLLVLRPWPQHER